MKRIRHSLGWTFMAVAACANACGDGSPAARSSEYDSAVGRTQAPRAVELPPAANAAIWLEERASGVRVGVVLEGALDRPQRSSAKRVTYADALGPGRDLTLRLAEDRIEDFVAFPERPADERASYRLD